MKIDQLKELLKKFQSKIIYNEELVSFCNKLENLHYLSQLKKLKNYLLFENLYAYHDIHEDQLIDYADRKKMEKEKLIKIFPQVIDL